MTTCSMIKKNGALRKGQGVPEQLAQRTTKAYFSASDISTSNPFSPASSKKLLTNPASSSPILPILQAAAERICLKSVAEHSPAQNSMENNDTHQLFLIPFSTFHPTFPSTSVPSATGPFSSLSKVSPCCFMASAYTILSTRILMPLALSY